MHNYGVIYDPGILDVLTPTTVQMSGGSDFFPQLQLLLQILLSA